MAGDGRTNAQRKRLTTLSSDSRDVTLARLIEVARGEAVLAATGQTFEAVAAGRARPLPAEADAAVAPAASLKGVV